MIRHSPQVSFKRRSNCSACALRNDSVMSMVPLESMAAFPAGIGDYSFSHGATIIGMGTPTDAVYCIRAGAVKMTQLNPAGVERIVRILSKGDVAGLESAFADHHEHASVAMGEVRACRIPITHFRHLVAHCPAFQEQLFERSQAALREAENWLAHLMGGAIPARVRIARLLLRLRSGDDGRIHRLRGEDMAAILGCTPETVSRYISAFVRQGLLVKKGNAVTSGYFRGDIASLERIAREGY